ncbi:hypothetical protein POM88_018268 [Heracleum sosnowskyi]|uniref:Uncharacterized protein n=1 Tax=Heracleum sosnowskyi TaxID=360622 RepID=A0AAD8MUK4_9APIA|nr:hypothetical protein POM88_018268 [Heracleum sosnowskyi]
MINPDPSPDMPSDPDDHVILMTNWETELRNEGFGQYKQIIKLRSKYNNAIMSSNINERKDDIMVEAQKLFKEGAHQTLVMLANTKVGGSTSAKRKTVTFSTNLT